MSAPAAFQPERAVTEAGRRTWRVLFEPFEPTRYAAIGFAVWLTSPGDALVQGCGVPTMSVNLDHLDLAPWVADLAGWPWVAAWVGAMAAIALAVSVLVAFVEARATFLTVDCLARDRADLGGAWTEYRREANALFGFRLVLFGAALAVVVASVAALAAALDRLDPSQAFVGAAALATLLIAVPVTGLFLVGAALHAVVTDLVVPLMYARRCGVRDGLREVLDLARTDAASLVTYVLVRIVAAFVVGGLVGVLGAATFGLTAIPFLGLLPVLPAPVFLRQLSLVFLGQVRSDLPFGEAAAEPPDPADQGRT